MAEVKVVFHPGASRDYETAFTWYYLRGTTVASDFEREIERGIRLVAEYPLRWPKFDEKRRRLIVRKFPYSIVYEIIDDQVVILAVAHGKRKPYYWRERTEER